MVLAKKPVSIGILVTEDDPAPESVYQAINKRFECFIGGDVTPYFVCENIFPKAVEDHDAYVITGSHYNVNEGRVWMNSLEVFICDINSKPKIKLFGICFGHQMIARALGGRVDRNPSMQFIWGCDKVEVKPELTSKSYFKNTGLESSHFYIMQSHFDQVIEKPANGKVLAGCEDCPYEMIAYGENILTMQGHPELTTERMLNKLPTIMEKNYLTENEASLARESMKNDQGDKLMAMIVSFLLS